MATKTEDRLAGGVLIAAAAASVLAMAHHPASAHEAGPGALVHGAMIALLGAMAFGLAYFALRRGLARPAVLAGLVAYGLSLVFHAWAATINGFVVPALAARGAAVGHDILLFAWEANQAMARLGVYATGTAFILWSIDLLRRGRDGTARAIGFAGLAAGAVPAAMLAAGEIAMDLAGALAVYAAHAAWTALIGLYLMRTAAAEG